MSSRQVNGFTASLRLQHSVTSPPYTPMCNIRKISIYFFTCLLFEKKRDLLCFTPENEFGNQLFLDSRFLVDFSTVSLVQVSGRFPDEPRVVVSSNLINGLPPPNNLLSRPGDQYEVQNPRVGSWPIGQLTSQSQKAPPPGSYSLAAFCFQRKPVCAYRRSMGRIFDLLYRAGLPIIHLQQQWGKCVGGKES